MKLKEVVFADANMDIVTAYLDFDASIVDFVGKRRVLSVHFIDVEKKPMTGDVYHPCEGCTFLSANKTCHTFSGSCYGSIWVRADA